MLIGQRRASKWLPASVVARLDQILFELRRRRIRLVFALFRLIGVNVAKMGDYYSTLPNLRELERTQHQWDRPSALTGLRFDATEQQRLLADLADLWEDDYLATTGDFVENAGRGFGPGFPSLDARVLYYMLRQHKPRRYLEVGSGLSTYYASMAAARNAAEGSPLAITCIEPYPYGALSTIDGLTLQEQLVQDVPVEFFDQLEAGDVLFIDSSHALNVGSDVTYLLLEVLPRVKPGVLVHIHDVPFPFNTPFPSRTWILGERWPVFWNEAMAVQAFLAFNDSFDITFSTSLVRDLDEGFLEKRFDDYTPWRQDRYPAASLWLRRTS